jgi:hypothetical protein
MLRSQKDFFPEYKELIHCFGPYWIWTHTPKKIFFHRRRTRISQKKKKNLNNTIFGPKYTCSWCCCGRRWTRVELAGVPPAVLWRQGGSGSEAALWRQGGGGVAAALWRRSGGSNWREETEETQEVRRLRSLRVESMLIFFRRSSRSLALNLHTNQIYLPEMSANQIAVASRLSYKNTAVVSQIDNTVEYFICHSYAAKSAKLKMPKCASYFRWINQSNSNCHLCKSFVGLYIS